MGTSFETFAIPGALGAEAVDTLSDWYERRGFVQVDGESLFDAPSDDERWVIVAADDRWTVVVDTDRDEHDRVGWELARLDAPVLVLWVHDSDVWGYRLLVAGREVESFCSNPRYFGGDAPDDETVPVELCRVAGLAGQESRVTEVLRQKRLFAERTLSRFAEVIGAPGAAADYRCWGGDDDARTKGYTVARLRFERPRPSIDIDVHADRYPRRLPRPGPRDAGGHPPLPPETAVAVAGLQTLGVVLSTLLAIVRFVLTPIGFVVRALFGWGLRPALATSVAARPGVDVDGRTVVSARHGLRFELPPAAELGQGWALGLFWFRLGGLDVSCSPRRPAELADQLAISHDAVVEDDTRYFAGDHAVRGLVWQELQRDGDGNLAPVHFCRDVVDAQGVLYVFWARSVRPIDRSTHATLRAAISTLRVARPSPPT